MLVSFEQMPETARVWVYQSERPLTSSEKELVEQAATDFMDSWSAHGQPLKASFKLSHDQFLIITVDESFSQASGCSIDASVHLIQAIQNQLGVSLLNNNKVAFLIDDQVELMPLNELKQKVTDQVITPSTQVFNNTIQSLSDFRSKWLVDSEKTWVNRYFS